MRSENETSKSTFPTTPSKEGVQYLESNTNDFFHTLGQHYAGRILKEGEAYNIPGFQKLEKDLLSQNGLNAGDVYREFNSYEQRYDPSKSGKEHFNKYQNGIDQLQSDMRTLVNDPTNKNAVRDLGKFAGDDDSLDNYCHCFCREFSKSSREDIFHQWGLDCCP